VVQAGVAGQRTDRRDLRCPPRGRDLPAPPPDAPGPFSLSDPDRVRSILTTAGFTSVDLERTTTDMWCGTDSDDAQRFVLGLMSWKAVRSR
jgi:hypothetical protein